MKRFLLSASLLVAGCAVALGPPKTNVHGLVVSMFDGTGRRVGTVTLQNDGSEVLRFAFSVRGLPPGPHAVHIHSIGLCERPDFLSAGPHLDIGHHQHGRNNPAGPHFGDLTDLVVGPDSTSHDTLTFVPPDGRLNTGAIFSGDGSAIVIHAAPDDQRTDPTGNSGARIACGILM